MTRAEFKANFPEFSASTYDDRIDALLLRVVNYVGAAEWGSFLAEGEGNWVADQLAQQDVVIALGATAAAASSVTSEMKVGDLSLKTSTSQSTSTGSQAADPYQRTSYGKRFSELRRMVGMGHVYV